MEGILDRSTTEQSILTTSVISFWWGGKRQPWLSHSLVCSTYYRLNLARWLWGYNSLYSLKLVVLSGLVDEAHQIYLEGRRPHVVVHLNDPVSTFQKYPGIVTDTFRLSMEPCGVMSNGRTGDHLLLSCYQRESWNRLLRTSKTLCVRKIGIDKQGFHTGEVTFCMVRQGQEKVRSFWPIYVHYWSDLFSFDDICSGMFNVHLDYVALTVT